jgi:hypothetical protein
MGAGSAGEECRRPRSSAICRGSHALAQMSDLHRRRLSWRDPFAVLLLANTVVAEARPFPDLTIETIELTVEQSIELPTKGAVHANQVWCATLPGFDELVICVERSERIEHFSNKARGQVQGIRSATPTTVAEHKQLDDAIKHIQSDARAAERYLRIGTGIGTGIKTQPLGDY